MNHDNSLRPGPGKRPLVSIGVPVHNGERFLGQALGSLLAQTVSNLELIVSDNASTDATRAICEAFARRDARVRYLRQPANIGAPRNWNAVVAAARGDFFKWASASDVCSPVLLERCIGALQAQPEAVLCYGHTRLIDEDDRPLRVVESDIDVNEPSPSERFRRVCTELQMNNAQCGVIRLEVLRRTALDRPYPSGDMALTAELALHGRLRLLPEVLVCRRHSKSTFTAMMSPLEVQRVYDPQATAPMRLIRARRHCDHLRSILRAPIDGRQKLRAWGHALRLAAQDRDHLSRELLSLFPRTRLARP